MKVYASRRDWLIFLFMLEGMVIGIVILVWFLWRVFA